MEIIILGLCGAAVLIPCLVVIGVLIWKQNEKTNKHITEENES